MREASIGELLRQARTKKGYDLEKTAELSGVPRHYLLAMEMDQFKLLPQESVNQFIEQYAEAVDLDGVSLIHGYRNMKLSQQQSKDLVEYSSTEETTIIEQESVPVVESVPVMVTPTKIEHQTNAVPVGKTRGSRHKEDNRSYLPFLILLALSIFIVGFVALITWQQVKKNSTIASEPSSYSVVSSSEETSSSSSQEESSSTSQPSLAVSGGGDSLAVTLTNPSSEVVLGFQLLDGGESWVAAYTDQLGEQGSLLTADNPEYQVTLPAGTTSTVLTLGNAQGLAVTIDGQKLDLSALTASLSYVTLTIQ